MSESETPVPVPPPGEPAAPERQTFPFLVLQFFIFPLGIVAVCVTVFVVFGLIASEGKGAREYLDEVRTGGANRRWQAAFELAKVLHARQDPAIADPAFAQEVIRAFEDSSRDDPRVRRYLALAIGRLDPPLPPAAIAALAKSLDDPERHWTPDWFSRLNGWSDVEVNEARISTIWALGSSGDPGVVPRLQPFYHSADAGIRKIVVYALGALPGDAQLDTLRTALEDSAPDVRWNAAVALARHDRRDGLPVLSQMLNRPYVEQAVKRDVRLDRDADPIADVMISSLRAIASLKDSSLRPSVEALSQNDRSLKVRQAALEALKEMEQAGAG